MPIFFPLLLVFVVGACVGSFLNVCIYRIPLEKSLLWPGSHCGQCVQPIRWYDNLPLLSYWLLRGRCRGCGTSFSARYFGIELFTALSFVGLFWLEIVLNVHDVAALRPASLDAAAHHLMWLDPTRVPVAGWGLLTYHCILVSFLLVTSFCDIDSLEIPFSITVTGALFGLAGGALLWPALPAQAVGNRSALNLELLPGVYPWPLWVDLPGWLPVSSPLTGLATGLTGLLAGMIVLRTVRFVFGIGRGIEGLGVGDADLMMMAGSFLGWQPVVVAFFVAVAPALLFGVGQIILRGSQVLPFGPSLALGVVITLLGWRWIGTPFKVMFFQSQFVIFMAVAGVVFLLIASFLLRFMRRG